ncbi:universal stress protein [Neolewinella agarilytica]|uniref:Nucleotide-binding universal stress protein, UspA family n=1 Tax=Neolewinella agarilytica TaxID=478744 RepID=A0A1H9KWU4_9BACT|nr:universal stress protein [Neolewinella agarilytica]SER03691.1 Nucleotide-binding universal stress protein, UspA family [Neolewinella agarilytica]
MKHLLVGIDFSKSADRALAYAEEIALQMKASISLVHIVPPAGTTEADEAKKRLTELADSSGSRGIKTAAYIYEGPVIETLKRVIDDGDCDLVVMGCQGENFLPENPWGSSTTSLMEDTRIPILAVPDLAPVKYPRRFLLATDKICPRHIRQLTPMLELLRADRTDLLLFHYLQATDRSTPDREYGRLLEGIKHRFYYQVDNQQPIGNAVVEFTELIDADILVVTHRDGHWLGSPTSDSVARRVTWASSVPVLVLQDSF